MLSCVCIFEAMMLFFYSFYILGEHSNTERGYLSAVLKDKLESMLKQDGIQVVVSQVDKDPLVIQ